MGSQRGDSSAGIGGPIKGIEGEEGDVLEGSIPGPGQRNIMEEEDMFQEEIKEEDSQGN